MRILIPLFTLLFFSNARAEEPLHFVAEVADEALAEDAILLVHCLSSRTGRGWELSADTRGPYSLRVTEKNAQLSAVYRAGAGEKTASFGAGASDEACEKLEPALAGSLTAPKAVPEARPLSALAPPPALAQAPPGELLAAVDEEPRPNKAYLWVGAGIAAVAGGYLLLHARSHRADYGSIQMN